MAEETALMSPLKAKDVNGKWTEFIQLLYPGSAIERFTMGHIRVHTHRHINALTAAEVP